MLTAVDVAKYFLVHQSSGGEPISNLKIQKLCYYAQGISLGILEKPLFFDKIENWQHGPVVEHLYHEYKSYGDSPVPQPTNLDMTLYSEEAADFLDKVYQLYGEISAWELRNRTHEESPWINTQGGSEITFTQLRTYFQAQANLYEEFGDLEPGELRRFPENRRVMKDLKRGVAAFKSGQMIDWTDVKERPGIE